MSHVKASGSVRQHPQSRRHGKRLGIKLSGGSVTKPGMIILRQRGAKYKAGKNVGMGKDHTIFSLIEGTVAFGKRFGRTVVNVVTQ
jgi:large subunit ribosomal protein L27